MIARDHLERPFRTLEHCGLYRRTIRLTCPECRQMRLLDAIPLWWLAQRKGWPDEIGAVVKHLYCRACRDVRQRVIRPRYAVTRETPTGPQFDYPDERVWKRVIARFRS